MGVAATNLSAPVTKTTSGILLLKEDSVFDPEQTACIRCGRCAEVCPQGLEPFAHHRFCPAAENIRKPRKFTFSTASNAAVVPISARPGFR